MVSLGNNTMKGNEHYGLYIRECFDVLSHFRSDDAAGRLVTEIAGKPQSVQADALIEYYDQVFPDHKYIYPHFEKVAEWLICEAVGAGPYGKDGSGIQHDDWWYEVEEYF